jgi:hypothetical protein
MKKNFPMLALALGATLFAAGVIYLFRLRFEAGDVYPAYSSLRADPLGTMALCESLAKLPGVTVRRDLSETSKLPEERNTTYLHLAAEIYDWGWMPVDVLNDMEAFATRGGRLVVTMRPVTGPDHFPIPPAFPITTTNTAATNAPTKRLARKKSNAKPGESLNQVSLQKRWGVEFGREKLKAGANDVYEPAEVVNQTDLPLPPSLDWHSALVLTNLDRAWRTIYAHGKNAVVAERKFGRGSVVIATDSYFVSNEAMGKDRQPELLAWLIGNSEQVVFDEAHLGVTETSGVAVLMRKYRLTGVIGGLALLALLFIWKNSTSLVPPYADAPAGGYIAGKDARAGFVNLLRRNIAPRDLLDVCFNEWTKALLHRRNLRIAGVDQAQTVMEAQRALPPGARNPVRAYQEISLALKPRAPDTTQSAIRNPQSAITDPTNP